MMADNLNVTSFNCQGVKNILPSIVDLCNKSHIVFLQETWLSPYELNILNDVHDKFTSFSLSSVDTSGDILVGRPYGGVSILWDKAISPFSSIVQYDDNRILGLSLAFGGLKYLFLNVYLPYCCADNLNEYDMYMGKIASIIDNSDVAGVVVLGDFNAGPTNNFYCELQQLCSVKNLIISDISRLPNDTYTHVNNGTLSRSWVDHCVSSQSMHDSITNISVDKNYVGSDHFPLHVSFNFEELPRGRMVVDGEIDKIKWNFRDDLLGLTFYSLLWQRLNFNPRHSVCNCPGNCNDVSHLLYLESLWNTFISIVKEVGEEVFGKVSGKKHCVPGWKDYVREFYLISRETFKLWKSSGSPRFGQLACAMRKSRADFKYALRQCRLRENEMRAEALSRKLQSGEVVPFWRDIQSIGKGHCILPERVDEAVGEKEIATLWKDKFSQVLNSVDDSKSKREFLSKILSTTETPIEEVTTTEVKKIVKNLANNKAQGVDCIPNEFYKYAPMNIITFLSIIFNAFLKHCFLPTALMNVLIVPLLKSKLKDPSSSANYRPIAIATAASKIFENIVLNRISQFLHTSSNQFGFKPNHSTEMCVFALKEVINYYRCLNTPIYLVFIDIKSAFDRVSYWELFIKLIDRGTPLHIVLMLKFWYISQSLLVSWGNSLSEPFNMGNGIRQGSILSPYLFNVYVDDLNHKLNDSGVGCHIAGLPMNNFSYADDLVLVSPSPIAANELLRECDSFAKANYILFSTTKSVCMRILPKSIKIRRYPAVYLGDSKLIFVESFNYLGHLLVSDFDDDEDIKKESRKLCYRGNYLIQKFKFCNEDVKCNLFKSYCYSLYCVSLWGNYRKYTLRRINVNYNNIMRRLMGVPSFSSASFLFGYLGVKSFKELIRTAQYSMMQRITKSNNVIMINLYRSEARNMSRIWQCWQDSLFL